MSQQSHLGLEERIAALEADRAGKSRRRYVTRKRFAVLLAIAALAAPAVVLASHQFTDVPNTNTFHNQISTLATAGITRGCNPANTLYCPADPVRRDQMAAFMIRSAGRMTQTTFDFPGVVDGSPFASLTVKTEGRAWINARGSFYFITDFTETTPVFPCENGVELVIDGVSSDNAVGWGRTNENPASGDWVIEMSTQEWSMPVDGGSHTVQLRWFDGDGDCLMEVGRGTLTAAVFPFDASNAGTPALPAGGPSGGGGSKSSGR